MPRHACAIQGKAPRNRERRPPGTNSRHLTAAGKNTGPENEQWKGALDLGAVRPQGPTPEAHTAALGPAGFRKGPDV